MKRYPPDYPRLLDSIRKHLAFEAAKPNPNPDMLLALCKLGTKVQAKIASEQAPPEDSETVGEDERK